MNMVHQIGEGESWESYRIKVVESLHELDQDLKELSKEVVRINLNLTKQVSILQVKASIYGTLGGLGGGIIIALIVQALSRR